MPALIPRDEKAKHKYTVWREGGHVKIDVDRIGVVAMNNMVKSLEDKPLNRPRAVCPTGISFVCSFDAHAVRPDPNVHPSFPARESMDKRLRQTERLRAGDKLLRALLRHIPCNGRLNTLELIGAPLMMYDWQRFAVSLRTTPSTLRCISLADSRLGDAGLAAVGPALLRHTTLETLSLARCSLTAAAVPWIVRLLQASNLRQNEGRRKRELRTWKLGLRGVEGAAFRDTEVVPGASLAADLGFRGPVEEEEEPMPVGISSLDLSGNLLADEGAEALAKCAEMMADLMISARLT